jgi:mannitol/fructose-specific phosphotransferase system IIA component
VTASLLEPAGVRLGLSATDRFDAVAQAGRALLELGAIDEPYMDAMQEREHTLSTFLGEGFALPHGTDASRAHVRRPAIAVLQFPDGVDWDGERVQVAIAVASASDEHIRVLAEVATVITDPDQAERLRGATDPAVVLDLLAPSPEQEEVTH